MLTTSRTLYRAVAVLSIIAATAWILQNTAVLAVAKHIIAGTTKSLPKPELGSYEYQTQKASEVDLVSKSVAAQVTESPKTSSVVSSNSTLLSSTSAGSTHPEDTISSKPVSKFGDQVVVMGKLEDEDTAWVTKLSSWDSVIYHVNDSNAFLHTKLNKGHEANVYLTFLIDNYDVLPSTIAFVHSHEDGYPRAWHTDAMDYSNVNSINSIDIDFIQRNGYANLRCIAIPGCPDEIQPFRDQYGESRPEERAYAEAWQYIFKNDDVPRIVGTPCCAQFAVSRAQVMRRSRAFYVRAQQWLMDVDLDDATLGRVFEYMWHIIFGQEAVYCPSLAQCYQDVYNREVA